ncbi:MAG: sulfatase-like hydrolase/transferase [archaeon]
MRKNLVFAFVAALVLFALALIAFHSYVSLENEVPSCPGCNVILVEFDGLNKEHVGFFGYSRETTPNIDAFARESFVFSEAVSPTPFTYESDISLFTGKKFSEHLKRRFFLGDLTLQSPIAPDEFEFLPRSLLQENYATAAFYGGLAYEEDLIKSIGFSTAKAGLDFGKIVPFAEDWLSNKGLSPGFLFLSNYDLHTPYTGNGSDYFFGEFGDTDISGVDLDWGKTGITKIEGKWLLFSLEKTGTGNGTGNGTGTSQTELSDAQIQKIIASYDGKLRRADFLFGRLIETLKKTGLYESSVIIFTSQHGEALGEHSVFGHGSSHPEVLSVPLIIRVPGHSGRVVSGPVSTKDLYYTIQEIVGAGRNLTESRNIFRQEFRRHAVGEVPLKGAYNETVYSYEINFFIDSFQYVFFSPDGKTLLSLQAVYPLPPRGLLEPLPEKCDGKVNYWALKACEEKMKLLGKNTIDALLREGYEVRKMEGN